MGDWRFEHNPRVWFQSLGDEVEHIAHCAVDKIFVSKAIYHLGCPFKDKIYISLQVGLLAKELLLLDLADEVSKFFKQLLSSFLLFF
jgi:hypothetical protein